MTAAAKTEVNGFSHMAEDTNRVTDIPSIDSISQKPLGGRSIPTQRKPLFSTLLHDRSVIEFSNVRLTCGLVYDGCTSIEWFKNGLPLPKDNRYQTIFHNGEAILEIATAEEHDSGHYVCKASNDYGETSSHSQLQIYKHYEDSVQPITFIQSIKGIYENWEKKS